MIRSKPIKTLSFFTLLGTAALFAATLLAAKGGKGGGNAPAPAVMEFRDGINDTIKSDGIGPYVDDISNLQVTVDSNVGNYSLHLYTPSGPTDRDIFFDSSQLIAQVGSTSPNEIPDGLGEIGFLLTAPSELPEPGASIAAFSGQVQGLFSNPSAPAGLSKTWLLGLEGTITAIDENTFVWEVSPSSEFEIYELVLRYRGKKLETDEFIQHGLYSNCSFAVTFTRFP